MRHSGGVAQPCQLLLNCLLLLLDSLKQPVGLAGVLLEETGALGVLDSTAVDADVNVSGAIVVASGR